jgi:plastocyanin
MGARVATHLAGLAVGLAALALPAAPVVAQTGGRVVGTVTVTEADGTPVPTTDVIVYIVGFTEPGTGQLKRIIQKGRKFIPDLIAITVNDRVSFPNQDPFLHNVFSSSADRKFDLGSFKSGDAKDRQFPKAGAIDVYCNIHPEMAATILVLPNRRHTQVTSGGSYVLEGVPPGDWTVFAYTRRAIKPTTARVSVKAGAETSVDLVIERGPEPEHLNKYGEKYHDNVPVYR